MAKDFADIVNSIRVKYVHERMIIPWLCAKFNIPMIKIISLYDGNIFNAVSSM